MKIKSVLIFGLLISLIGCEKNLNNSINTNLSLDLIDGTDQNWYFLEPTSQPITITVGDSVSKVVFKVIEGDGQINISYYNGPNIGKIENPWLLGCNEINKVRIYSYSNNSEEIMDSLEVTAIAEENPNTIWKHSCGFDIYTSCDVTTDISPFCFNGITSIGSNCLGHIFIMQASTFFVSYDGGKSFEKYTNNDLGNMLPTGVFFNTESGMIYAKGNGRLLVSDSIQSHWDIIDIDSDIRYSSFKIFNNQNIIARSESSSTAQYFSSDGGKSWKQFDISYTESTGGHTIIEDYIIKDNLIYAIDDEKNLIISSDNCTNWLLLSENIINPVTQRSDYFKRLYTYNDTVYLEAEHDGTDLVSLYKASDLINWELLLTLDENEKLKWGIKDFSTNEMNFYSYSSCGRGCWNQINIINFDGSKEILPYDLSFTESIFDFRIIDSDRMFLIGHTRLGGYVNF